MLINLPTKKLVLKLKDPRRITAVIPTAKPFEYEGAQLVAVPYRLDEVRVLRNMGIRAPSPIKYLYDYPRHPRIKDPFFAQKETAEFLTLNPKAFVLNDLGTGKTLAALWARDFLVNAGEVQKTLVISPLSTLERTWADEIFQNFPETTVAVLHGTKERRLKLLAGDYDIFLINHHGVKVIETELKAMVESGYINLVIVDEIATFRNAQAQLYKALKRVIAKSPRVWGLTGTPTPNQPTDAWAQCKLICPERVPKFFTGFRDQVMQQLGQFRWLAREGATEIVADAMQPSIRFKREDCIDLPPAIYQTREVDLTPEQAKAYKDMLAKLHMEYEGGQVLAVNEAVKMAKLVQIACGVVYGAGDQEVVLPNKPRIDEVKDIVDQAGSKVIVFVPYKSVVRYVAEELRRAYGEDDVAVVSGDVSATARGKIFKDFQTQGRPRILVAQPAAMSHGLTLTAASTIVWYSAVTSQETYSQANGRITRPGQSRTQFIVHIEGSAVERRIFKRLQDKKKMEGLLLEMIREGT